MLRQNFFLCSNWFRILLDKHNKPALPDFYAKNKKQIYSINVERIDLVINYLNLLA